MKNDFIKLAIAAVALTITPLSFAAGGHVSGCEKKDGIEKLRCERHLKMAEKCGPLQGDSHFACDREFLLANPLECAKLTDKAANSCAAETNAFKTCEANLGRDRSEERRVGKEC